MVSELEDDTMKGCSRQILSDRWVVGSVSPSTPEGSLVSIAIWNAHVDPFMRQPIVETETTTKRLFHCTPLAVREIITFAHPSSEERQVVYV